MFLSSGMVSRYIPGAASPGGYGGEVIGMVEALDPCPLYTITSSGGMLDSCNIASDQWRSTYPAEPQRR